MTTTGTKVIAKSMKTETLAPYWWLNEDTATLMKMANRLYRNPNPSTTAQHSMAAALETVLLNRGFKYDQYLCVGGPGCKDFHREGNVHEY